MNKIILSVIHTLKSKKVLIKNVLHINEGRKTIQHAENLKPTVCMSWFIIKVLKVKISIWLTSPLGLHPTPEENDLNKSESSLPEDAFTIVTDFLTKLLWGEDF